MTVRSPSQIDARKVELVLAQLDAIPPLSPIATRILALTEDDRSSARQIVELISSDPPLTARVLSILGRAEHGVRREAVSLENAVKYLGFTTVRQVTLALKVMEVFGGEAGHRVEGFDRTEFWKHCLATACAARAVALELKRGPGAEEAFIAGLLHDLGKVALERAMPKSFERVVRRANETRGDLTLIERDVLGVDHAVVGHRLAERWSLPARVAECIRHHHQPADLLPPSVSSGLHVQVVQLADAIAREQRIGYSGNHRVAVASRALAAQLGLTNAQTDRIVEGLAVEIERRAAWVGADEIDTRRVYLRALLQTTDELTAANAALSKQNRVLARQASCFAALRLLNQSLSARGTVRDACGAGAAVFQKALDLPAVLVFVVSGDLKWLDTGLCDGGVKTAIEPVKDAPVGLAEATGAAVDMSAAGIWFTEPGAGFAWLVDRYRGRLGTDRFWIMPIVHERAWVGGVMISASAERVAALRAEVDELESLSTAVGLAISQAQARAAAVSLGDELAEVNRHLAAMQEELLTARTHETVVAMAAGAAHELNNPLSIIAGRAQLLQKRTQQPDVREQLDVIARHAHLCSGIVTELMEFARAPSPRPESIDLGPFLEALRTELVADGLLAEPVMSIDVPAGTPEVRFDRDQLRRVFRELLANAVEAAPPPTGRVSIKARAFPSEEGLVVSVIDNGRGMTPEVLARAPDPFFSHRPAGRGRGLGLARVQRWLRQGGGSIRLESEPGRGTTAVLTLPTVARE